MGILNGLEKFYNNAVDQAWKAVTGNTQKNTSTTTPAQTAGTQNKAPTFNYTQSQKAAQKDAAVEQLNANRPGDFSYSQQTAWDDIVNQIMNGEKFSYDLNGDALYQQYKDQYTTQGKMAMMDAMGQAQAATGGYGNSYAQAVGQQAYQGYLQQLNDKVPELYQLALDKYNQDRQDLYNQYGMHSDNYAREYGVHRDSVSDWENERNYLTEDARYTNQTEYNQQMDKYNIDYGTYRDAVEDDKWNQSFDYQKERDAVADAQYDKSFQYQVGRDSVNDYWRTIEYEYQKERDATEDAKWNKQYDLSTAPSYRNLDVGSDAYNAMSDEISSAGSWSALQNIAAKYAAMGYNPDVIEALTSAKEKELKNKTSSTGNNNSVEMVN